MLKHSLAEPGTLVARTVALVLAEVAPTDNTHALLNDLQDHSSAIIRHTISAAIGCKSDYDHVSSLAVAATRELIKVQKGFTSRLS
ncbi:hypothetical protein ACFXGA_00910 [Actinosynnema sp. NPDC059335]|uniref:hypothetical protein n=1 Tax=Actinosynnema sp. NPDC059335 TaxID=3346804 RepID=UPI0036705F60